jgi:hypothetical protein
VKYKEIIIKNLHKVHYMDSGTDRIAKAISVHEYMRMSKRYYV